MVREHALLDVIPEQASSFEVAFREAVPIIASMPGFISLRLERCIENSSRYALAVEWRRIEDHTEGFRNSDEYQEWRGRLHHFYRAAPTVEHYESVAAS